MRLEDGGTGGISSFTFWGVMVCTVEPGGKLEFGAAKVKNNPCNYVLAAYFGLAQSQVLKPKVLFGSSGVFLEFSGAWREVHWVCILLVLKCFSRQLKKL